MSMGGDQNIFAHLRKELDEHRLFDVVCNAHLMHTAIEQFQPFFDILQRLWSKFMNISSTSQYETQDCNNCCAE